MQPTCRLADLPTSLVNRELTHAHKNVVARLLEWSDDGHEKEDEEEDGEVMCCLPNAAAANEDDDDEDDDD